MSSMSGTRRLSSFALGVVLLGLLGLQAPAEATTDPSPARATTLTTAQFEARLVALTNERRKKIGCPALRVNSILVGTARAHSTRMVQTGSFSHQVSRESSLGTRITRAGYKGWTMLAENIAWGQSITPWGVFNMWMHSSGHRANIQNCRLREVGYGVRYSGRSVWTTGDYGRR